MDDKAFAVRASSQSYGCGAKPPLNDPYYGEPLPVLPQFTRVSFQSSQCFGVITASVVFTSQPFPMKSADTRGGRMAWVHKTLTVPHNLIAVMAQVPAALFLKTAKLR
jgi:hypothetical protein